MTSTGAALDSDLECLTVHDRLETGVVDMIEDYYVSYQLTSRKGYVEHLSEDAQLSKRFAFVQR